MYQYMFLKKDIHFHITSEFLMDKTYPILEYEHETIIDSKKKKKERKK